MENIPDSKPINLYQKLLLIQKEVKGLSKDKDGYNYKYVTGEKVLEHIKPLMNKYGLLLKQEVISIENTRQDYTNRNQPKSEILTRVMMRFTWVDCETGQTDENLFGANGQNEWEKGLGSALTYGERYFLLKFFHIATDEDDVDNPDRKSNEAEKKPVEAPQKTEQPITPNPAKKPTNPATDKQKDLIIKTINSKVFEKEKPQILSELNNYSVDRAKKCINWLLKELTLRKETNA